MASELPQLPASHRGLVAHIANNPDQSMVKIMQPYRHYEARLREVYAQDRQNPILNDPYLNVVPLFTEDTARITTRARDLSIESEEEKARYIMPLPEDKRRSHGSPATVANLTEFQHNFNIFSESSLVEMDWNNVVAAGSSVVNCLLPVPKEFRVSKRKLREYYHEKFCPASDVDLFLYGLTHDQAIEKIKQIETAIKDALLNEVTVVRTKYAITIASQYPVRHVQIVLRVYKTISEILTGFDIDAAGGAYDGKQVYVTPRALGSFITQINHVDLSRRSPSYENRLSKYSHRNFEVYWPELDRSKVDPTIFERSFQRTLGLARLLVLERLPTNFARETYLNKRRAERGRPTRFRAFTPMRGNIKDSHEDEVADWLSEEDVSNYHTFTVPYGERFNAKRIEKLCYTRDLLLNAEWNQPKDRPVYLHRHPAFFGRVEDVIEDCCGTCPKAVTPEEIELAEKEAEIYISGKVEFLIDDPGRQQIGSFNPLTEHDWTDMAYVGNTARLCQSIVDGDVEDILNWLAQEGADPNKRDYTGRTPLQLAVTTSTPGVVKCLVDHGARLVARLADGRTALHLAAARGETEMIKILMEKSIENEEAEEERQARRRKATLGDNVDGVAAPQDSSSQQSVDEQDKDDDAESTSQNDYDDKSDEGELIDGDQTELDVRSLATGSFVNVSKKNGENTGDLVPGEVEDEPDYYQIDVLAWDTPCSPLHLAIAEGHEETVKVLCDYGADSILPVKFLNNNNNSSDTAAILTLTLALSLPNEKAVSMARLLLKLGATSSQADAQGCTALYKFVESGRSELVDTLLENDEMGVKTALNHLIFSGYSWSPETTSPLHGAVQQSDSILTLKLLNAGALPEVDFDTWLKAAKVAPDMSRDLGDLERSKKSYKKSYESPLCTAIRYGNTDGAMKLLENGADVNALTHETNDAFTNDWRWRYTQGTSVLDLVQDMIKILSKYKGEKSNHSKPTPRPGLDTYLDEFNSGTYKHWMVSQDIQDKNKSFAESMAAYEKSLKRAEDVKGAPEKLEAVQEALAEFKTLEKYMVSRGAKTFEELYPKVECEKRKTKDVDHGKGDKNDSYKYEFTFKTDKDMTETRSEGYLNLMEAAWSGDLQQIKELTLQAWGNEKDQAPLKIVISDHRHNSPLSLAFLKGRYDVARAILEIVKAQWSAPDKDELRYKMRQEDEDGSECYSDDDEDNESDSEPQIVSEVVDKNFTIEDIGQVCMQVKSHVTPVQHLCETVPTFTLDNGKATKLKVLHSTLFQHVMETDNIAGMKVLLDLAQHFGEDKLSGDEEETGGKFIFPESDFRWAVEHGKTQMLSLIIKRTGAGIPLDHLVKKSGVEVKDKPRFYQGLTVYGKKRKDWANAGRNVVSRTSGMRTPPLLHAALGGSVDGVEFFLGDKAHRLYAEFGKSKAAREDSRLKHLNQNPGIFDRAISKWLGADNDLVIHCAVLGNSKESVDLVEFLVTNTPEYLEKKNSDGETPLMIACRLGRIECVKILVDAGADQSTRNQKGENILHACLSRLPKAAQLKPMLDLFDTDLRSHLFLQRKNITENGTTPLHTWICLAAGLGPTGENDQRHNYYHYRGRYIANPTYTNGKDEADMIKLLLEYSNGEELDMLNGAGETCLHTATKQDKLSLVKVLVGFNPRQLHRENAVGRTPAELAHDGLINNIFSRPSRPQINRNEHVSEIVTKSCEVYSVERTLSRNVSTQINDIGLSGAYTAKELALILSAMGVAEVKSRQDMSTGRLRWVIWDVMSTAIRKHDGKRRLVSLNEANDVARRLGEKHTGSRYFSVESRRDADDEVNSEDGKKDESSGDFATRELEGKMNTAWSEPKKENESDSDDNDDDEDSYDDDY